MTKLYEVLNRESGEKETLVEGFGPVSPLLDTSLIFRDEFVSMDEDDEDNEKFVDIYTQYISERDSIKKVDLWKDE